MAKTQVIKCTCKHEYQDKKYGVGRRLMNATLKSKANNTIVYRCTVCKTELNGKV